MNSAVLGAVLLADFSAYYGVVSTNPAAVTDMGGLTAYLSTAIYNVGTGKLEGLTGEGAAISMAGPTVGEDFKIIMGGCVDYIMANASLVCPPAPATMGTIVGLVPADAFNATKSAYLNAGGELPVDEPLNILVGDIISHVMSLGQSTCASGVPIGII